MKLQVVLNRPAISSFHHVGPAYGTSIKNLDCSDNECEFIVADDICDYIEHDELFGIIKHYVSKLRHQGSIVIGGTEIFEIAKILLFETNLESFNKTVFGSSKELTRLKSGATSMFYIIDILVSLGLKITKKRIDAAKFIVEAFRE